MERSPIWRPIEPDEPADGERPARTMSAEQPATDGLRLTLAGLAGVAVLAAAALILWAGTPQPQVVLEPDVSPPASLAGQFEPGTAPASAQSPAELLVDVQGAVARPGLHRLAVGSRVGDAIAAAGGYGPQVDVRAAAERLNLAEQLADGSKIYVPAMGDPTPGPPLTSGPAAPGSGGAEPIGGGLVDVNLAGQAELETLPGIGPVTAAKIIAAREAAAFATVDDLLTRKVVGPATFEKIRTLISVSP